MRAVMAALVGLGVMTSSLATPTRATAQTSDPCMGLVSSREVRIHRVALGAGEIGITFVGHATFLLESPGGIKIATDYNDYVRPSVVPDIATMNHAHSTHYTNNPDPGIPHVLKGWNPGGGAARHDMGVGDVRVRNVPTSIRDIGGGTERDGNSIFVFEMAGLCVAHLGHLHHTLLPGHLKLLGHIDVLLVPVDGSYTLDMEGMFEVMQSINAPLMIPMHFFGQSTLNRFLNQAQKRWTVERSPTASITVTRETLPTSPKVLVLPGR
jgi:L-ascorbate metabolism protein UlaG (beta-lactamase superfamily)